MKLKTIMYLVLVAILSPLFSSSVNNYTEAETVNDLLVTYGENLLPLTSDACNYTNGTLSSKKKIYYPGKYSDTGLWAVVPKSSENVNLSIEFTFYDINFKQTGSFKIFPYGVDEDETFGLYQKTGDNPYYTGNAYDIPSGTFSFSFVMKGLNENVTLANLGVMILDVSKVASTGYVFKDYVSTRGFMDLCEDITPTIYLGYKTTYTKDYIDSLVECIDACQGNVKDQITVDSSSYLASPNIIGSYTINIKLKSDTSNTPIGSFTIKVEDKINPVIEGSDSIDVPAKTTIDRAYLVSKGYLFTDDYDDTNSIDTTLLLDPSFDNTNSLVTGTIKMTLLDSSSNKAEKTINVTIVDVTPPTIETKESNITISYDYLEGVTSLISKAFTITDDYSLSPTVTIITDNYTENRRVVGTYDVKIEATDDYSNSSQATFSVTVYDDIPPVIFLNTYKIETDVTVKLTQDDIMQTLMTAGVLDSSTTYSVTVLNDEYTGNEAKVGVYNYQLKCETQNGESLIKTLEITVIDKKEYGGNIEKTKAKFFDDEEKTKTLFIVGISLIGVGGLTILIVKKRRKNIRPRRY